jgi:serine protease inhibitor
MKIIYLIAAIAMMCQTCIALDQSIYTDTILSVYNSTCIETANWKYVFINNTSLTQEDIYKNIFVSEIKELGNNSLLANIFL